MEPNVLKEKMFPVCMDNADRVGMAKLLRDKHLPVQIVTTKWVPNRLQKVFYRSMDGAEVQVRRILGVQNERYLVVSEDEQWYTFASLDELTEHLSFYRKIVDED